VCKVLGQSQSDLALTIVIDDHPTANRVNSWCSPKSKNCPTTCSSHACDPAAATAAAEHWSLRAQGWVAQECTGLSVFPAQHVVAGAGSCSLDLALCRSSRPPLPTPCPEQASVCVSFPAREIRMARSHFTRTHATYRIASHFATRFH
jgi:hypothetical protein